MTTEIVPKFVPSDNRIRKVTPEGNQFEYEIFKVVDEYDDALKAKTVDWDFQNPPGDLNYIAISMIHTMIQNGGIGLAANQCGLPYRIFVMGTGQYVEVVVNPEITKKDGEQFDIEGCLSSPGLFLKIKRAQLIEVKYFNLNKALTETKFEGLTARIFQHEFDHLEGVRYVDLVSKITLARGKEKVKKNLRKIRDAREQALADAKKRQQQAVLQSVQAAKPLANTDVIKFNVDTSGQANTTLSR